MAKTEFDKLQGVLNFDLNLMLELIYETLEEDELKAFQDILWSHLRIVTEELESDRS